MKQKRSADDVVTATLEMEAYTIKPGMLSPMCKVKSKKRVREWDRLVAAVETFTARIKRLESESALSRQSFPSKQYG